jgi:hypothetical protein
LTEKPSVAIDPLLLFDRRELEQDNGERWIRRHRYEELFEHIKHWLREDDTRSLRGYGEPHIYRVGEWYELDHDLTSMLDNDVLLLARAALATGCKMPCKLVGPPLGRNRRRSNTVPAAPDESTARLGQMRFC